MPSTRVIADNHLACRHVKNEVANALEAANRVPFYCRGNAIVFMWHAYEFGIPAFVCDGVGNFYKSVEVIVFARIRCRGEDENAVIAAGGGAFREG